MASPELRGHGACRARLLGSHCLHSTSHKLGTKSLEIQLVKPQIFLGIFFLFAALSPFIVVSLEPLYVRKKEENKMLQVEDKLDLVGTIFQGLSWYKKKKKN